MATLLSVNVCYCPETRIKTNKSRGTGNVETGGLASTKFIEGQPTDLHITRHMDLIQRFVFAIQLIMSILRQFSIPVCTASPSYNHLGAFCRV